MSEKDAGRVREPYEVGTIDISTNEMSMTNQDVAVTPPRGHGATDG